MNLCLATINARYIHTSFALKSLYANLGETQKSTTLLDFTLVQRVDQMAEAILCTVPDLVGFSVYIWNRDPLERLVRYLKAVAPQLPILVGGPEVSWSTSGDPLLDLTDYVLVGEGELTLPWLLGELARGATPPKRIQGEPPDLSRLALPYAHYTDEEIAHRIVYVETSRGCPWNCRFCLSARDRRVRRFPLESLLREFQVLWDRGVRHFKFLDRDITLGYPERLFRFFLSREEEPALLHFELVPGRLTPPLFQLLSSFSPGRVQLEIGVQTLTPAVAKLIRRVQDNTTLLAEITRLSTQTGCHIHSDLIFGLPMERLEEMGRGFDRLVATGVEEIQVGMLKLLRGAPLEKLVQEYNLVFSPSPPYEIIQTGTVDFPTMQRLRRFARYWDLVGNSGNFKNSLPLLFRMGTPLGSPFSSFLDLSDWLHETLLTTHSIGLNRLTEALYRYLLERGTPEQTARTTLLSDFQRLQRTKIPACLQRGSPHPKRATRRAVPTLRQGRHHLK